MPCPLIRQLMQFLPCASAVPSAEQTQPLPVLMLFLFQWEVAQQIQTEIVSLVLPRNPHLGGWSSQGSVAGTTIPHSAALSTHSTFSCLLLTWLQDIPSDFDEPPHFSSLKELVSFAQVVLPGSALESQAQDRLFWLERSVASETQTQGEEHGGGDGWDVREEMGVTGPKSIFAFGQGVKRGISPPP